MNNLPNTKRKSENVHSFLAFLLFICFSFTSYYIQAQEVKGITLNVQNETAENVFNGTSHYMVNTRHTVCGWRALVEYECRMSLSCFKTLMEDVSILPFLQHLFIDVRQVKFRVFGKFLTHMRYIYLSSQKLPQR